MTAKGGHVGSDATANAVPSGRSLEPPERAQAGTPSIVPPWDPGKIPVLFAEYFEHWQITLPHEAIRERTAGRIQSHGWTIHYCFGTDDRGGYLDFYASHRMTNDRHERLYASGETEALPALLDFIVYPANATPKQQEERQREYDEHNRRVIDELKRKDFW